MNIRQINLLLFGNGVQSSTRLNSNLEIHSMGHTKSDSISLMITLTDDFHLYQIGLI